MGKPDSSPAGLLQLLWEERRHVLRAWLWFVGSLVFFLQGLIWIRPWTDGTLTKWIAAVCSIAMRVLGNESNARGSMIITSMGTFEIIRECTGVYPNALFASAVLAYPCSWGRKLLGIGIGIVSIQMANVVRITSLFYIREWWPESFDTAHMVVWQSLIVFFALLVWVVWAVELSGTRQRHAA